MTSGLLWEGNCHSHRISLGIPTNLQRIPTEIPHKIPMGVPTAKKDPHSNGNPDNLTSNGETNI